MYSSHESRSRLGYNCPTNAQSQESSSQPALGVPITLTSNDMPNALYTGHGAGIHGGLMLGVSCMHFDTVMLIFPFHIFSILAVSYLKTLCIQQIRVRSRLWQDTGIQHQSGGRIRMKWNFWKYAVAGADYYTTLMA